MKICLFFLVHRVSFLILLVFWILGCLGAQVCEVTFRLLPFKVGGEIGGRLTLRLGRILRYTARFYASQVLVPGTLYLPAPLYWVPFEPE